MRTIDLNADLGETVAGVRTADDAAMFALISSASVATGGHAGDAASMREAVDLAAHFGVAVGAHPSFVDRAGFGRVAHTVDPAELRAQVRAQLAQLIDVGADLRYVKPHGALYHAVSADPEMAAAVADAVHDASAALGRALPLLGLGGHIVGAAESRGLPFFAEAFLDRGYLATGGLAPRTHPQALVQDADEVAERAVRMVTHGSVTTIDGAELELDAVSLCVHGDSPGAVAMAQAVRRALEAAGVRIVPPW